MSSPNPQVKKLQKQLLDWFSKHRRVMPWRAAKGKTPDPYRIWLSEIMLQQTTVATVGPYFMKFIAKWPTVHDLASAELDDILAAWAGLGYYARARNLHKCAQIIANDLGGEFPSEPVKLQELPGIGPYTAAAIASIAFNVPAAAVDGNVERVVSRFFAIRDPLPRSKNTLLAHAKKLVAGNSHPGDFTQAFMELGSLVCTPKKPKCTLCPWQKSCLSYRKGIAEELPRTTPKAEKPVLYGKVFWIRKKSGDFLIEKKNSKGVFEGMYLLPTTEWTKDKASVKRMPCPHGKNLRPKPMNMAVRHSFTHFNLVLEIWSAPAQKDSGGGKFVSPQKTSAYALPSLMQKVVRLCLGQD